MGQVGTPILPPLWPSTHHGGVGGNEKEIGGAERCGRLMRII
nr:MAG TPA: hypothetical protein [Caudoviricetes sp.]